MEKFKCYTCEMAVEPLNLGKYDYYCEYCDDTYPRYENFYGNCEECGHFLEPNGSCLMCPFMENST